MCYTMCKRDVQGFVLALPVRFRSVFHRHGVRVIHYQPTHHRAWRRGQSS